MYIGLNFIATALSAQGPFFLCSFFLATSDGPTSRVKKKKSSKRSMHKSAKPLPRCAAQSKRRSLGMHFKNIFETLYTV